MLYGEINRQRLKIINEHVVADTIDYLEARFAFSEDWDGLEKWVHFAKNGEVYDIRLTDDCIRKEDHLNLSAGIWKVYLHGNEFSGGKVIERITTNAAILKVEPTGTLDGEPFPEMPASVTEQILARLDAVKVTGIRAEQKTVEGSLLDTSYTEITVELADGSEKTCRLPNTGVKETLILDSMPNGGTVGYVGQMAFVKSTGQMYVCVVGLVGDYSYVPSYEWQQAKDIRIESGAPTTGSAGKWGDVWIDVSEPAVYICGGYTLVPPNYKYIWKQVGGSGGLNPVDKTDAMIQPVGRDDQGRLWTAGAGRDDIKVSYNEDTGDLTIASLSGGSVTFDETTGNLTIGG